MELDQHLDVANSFFNKVEASSLHSFYTRNPNIRPTLSVYDKEKSKNFGPDKIMSLNPPSSEEESEYDFIIPSVNQVIEKIFDSEHTSITVFTHTGRAYFIELSSTNFDNLWLRPQGQPSGDSVCTNVTGIWYTQSFPCGLW